MLPDRQVRAAARKRRAHLRYTVAARLKVWAAWAQLGQELDVPELRQLAQQVAVAGDEGARMRQALVAMAGALRDQEVAEAEVRAGEASEHMVLPLTFLGGGFLLFLVIPALSRVLGTFGL